MCDNTMNVIESNTQVIETRKIDAIRTVAPVYIILVAHLQNLPCRPVGLSIDPSVYMSATF